MTSFEKREYGEGFEKTFPAVRWEIVQDGWNVIAYCYKSDCADAIVNALNAAAQAGQLPEWILGN